LASKTLPHLKKTCPRCSGLGRYISGRGGLCEMCGGSGAVPVTVSDVPDRDKILYPPQTNTTTRG
jgi:hypothetical protein